MHKYDVIIIGAGASGLIAADIAARNYKKILLIEKMDQPGRKLRLTGKGRCNITNVSSVNDFIKHVGSDGRFLKNAFSIFFINELMAYFEEIGLPLKIERGNRVFPKSDKAQDVFFALIKRLENYSNVTILKKTSVAEILISTKGVSGVKSSDGKTHFSEKVILASGGLSYPLTGSTGDGYKLAKKLGHTISQTYPALVPLVSEEFISDMAVDFTAKNVKMTAYLKDEKLAEHFGELKFTENGIGGPIVLTLSRLLTKGLSEGQRYMVKIDFKPALQMEVLDKEVIRVLNENGGALFFETVRRWLPEQLIMLMLEFTRISRSKKSHQISAAERKGFLEFLKAFPLNIIGTRGFEEAVITQGGISLKEINPKTMESKLVKNLYFAGEVMDLDADTGGYNLQIAFTTGYISGMNI